MLRPLFSCRRKKNNHKSMYAIWHETRCRGRSDSCVTKNEQVIEARHRTVDILIRKFPLHLLWRASSRRLGKYLISCGEIASWENARVDPVTIRYPTLGTSTLCIPMYVVAVGIELASADTLRVSKSFRSVSLLLFCGDGGLYYIKILVFELV